MLSLRITVTKFLITHLTYTMKNSSCSIDVHFQNGAGSMCPIFLIIQMVNTAINIHDLLKSILGNLQYNIWMQTEMEIHKYLNRRLKLTTSARPHVSHGITCTNMMLDPQDIRGWVYVCV
jgi:hypothetical protein